MAVSRFSIDSSDSECYTATDLKREWRQCCLDAMGYKGSRSQGDMPDRPDPDAKRSRITIVNLVPPNSPNAIAFQQQQPPTSSKTTNSSVDAWIQTALQVQNNILEMAAWIQKKKWDYVSVNMPDDEASLIASTVTSFIPTTANEVETLRQMVAQGGSSIVVQSQMQQQHRMGIVQILLVQLRERVADPFGLLQKQRSRTAVALWQNPLQCRLMVPNAAAVAEYGDDGEDALDSALGLSPSLSARERQQRQCFVPTRPAHLLQRGFLESYKDPPRRKQRPESVLFHRPATLATKKPSRSSDNVEDKNAVQVPVLARHRPSTASHDNDADTPQEADANTSSYLSPAALQQESLLIAVNHDLDSVQQMEQRMVDITTLLSQFASLVTEQQEFVQDIYESTSDAKSNMEKGQEELLKAKETVRAGKHYTAKAITAMGVALLVLHWIIP